MVPDEWLSTVPTAAWPDERLVHECVRGNQEAWTALIEKYKNLIFSIPIRLGMSREDAGEIFQQVCLALIRELPRLRDAKSLGGWLIKVTSHSCYEWKRRHGRYQTAGTDLNSDAISPSPSAEELAREVEREQMLRDAIAEAHPRCRQLIGMLFFDDPPLPYQEVAKRLGIATGSIGFIRMRCLQKLRVSLQKKDF